MKKIIIGLLAITMLLPSLTVGASNKNNLTESNILTNLSDTNTIEIGGTAYEPEDLAYEIYDIHGNVRTQGLVSELVLQEEDGIQPILDFDVAGKSLANGETMAFFPAGTQGFYIIGGTVVRFDWQLVYNEDAPRHTVRLSYDFNGGPKVIHSDTSSQGGSNAFITDWFGYYKLYMQNISSDPVTLRWFKVTF